MSTCQLPYADSILLELLEVAIHQVLYQKSIYPETIFVLKKKYGAPVHVSRYPPLNSYINDSLIAIKDLLLRKQLKSVHVCFFNNDYSKLLERLVFNVQNVFSELDPEKADQMSDPYLTKLQESIRAVCLRLTTISAHTKPLGEEAAFQIQIETTESAAASLADDPDHDHFPWIEIEDCKLSQDPTSVELLPIRNIKSDLFEVEMFYQKME
ncbi:unnamed protein product [Bemisia tabaci]|uniref:HORMA domain-containing protein n=1 Tax=Bemisia tabaci TaxID=7038 RepID=A0A9P0AEJ9_BEMTA|nr:unnamed protein product [Bemisia tabaci]